MAKNNIGKSVALLDSNSVNVWPITSANNLFYLRLNGTTEGSGEYLMPVCGDIIGTWNEGDGDSQVRWSAGLTENGYTGIASAHQISPDDHALNQSKIETDHIVTGLTFFSLPDDASICGIPAGQKISVLTYAYSSMDRLLERHINKHIKNYINNNTESEVGFTYLFTGDVSVNITSSGTEIINSILNTKVLALSNSSGSGKITTSNGSNLIFSNSTRFNASPRLWPITNTPLNTGRNPIIPQSKHALFQAGLTDLEKTLAYCEDVSYLGGYTLNRFNDVSNLINDLSTRLNNLYIPSEVFYNLAGGSNINVVIEHPGPSTNNYTINLDNDISIASANISNNLTLGESDTVNEYEVYSTLSDHVYKGKDIAFADIDGAVYIDGWKGKIAYRGFHNYVGRNDGQYNSAPLHVNYSTWLGNRISDTWVNHPISNTPAIPSTLSIEGLDQEDLLSINNGQFSYLSSTIGTDCVYFDGSVNLQNNNKIDFRWNIGDTGSERVIVRQCAYWKDYTLSDTNKNNLISAIKDYFYGQNISEEIFPLKVYVNNAVSASATLYDNDIRNILLNNTSSNLNNISGTAQPIVIKDVFDIDVLHINAAVPGTHELVLLDENHDTHLPGSLYIENDFYIGGIKQPKFNGTNKQFIMANGEITGMTNNSSVIPVKVKLIDSETGRTSQSFTATWNSGENAYVAMADINALTPRVFEGVVQWPEGTIYPNTGVTPAARGYKFRWKMAKFNHLCTVSVSVYCPPKRIDDFWRKGMRAPSDPMAWNAFDGTWIVGLWSPIGDDLSNYWELNGAPGRIADAATDHWTPDGTNWMQDISNPPEIKIPDNIKNNLPPSLTEPVILSWFGSTNSHNDLGDDDAQIGMELGLDTVNKTCKVRRSYFPDRLGATYLQWQWTYMY